MELRYVVLRENSVPGRYLIFFKMTNKPELPKGLFFGVSQGVVLL